MDGVTAILWLIVILSGFAVALYWVIQFLKWW